MALKLCQIHVEIESMKRSINQQFQGLITKSEDYISLHALLRLNKISKFKHTSPGVLDGSLTKAPWPCPQHMISRSIYKGKAISHNTITQAKRNLAKTNLSEEIDKGNYLDFFFMLVALYLRR